MIFAKLVVLRSATFWIRRSGAQLFRFGFCVTSLDDLLVYEEWYLLCDECGARILSRLLFFSDAGHDALSFTALETVKPEYLSTRSDKIRDH
jgi:hypothetical protein